MSAVREERAEHEMRLDPRHFQRMKSGHKTIELRLLDEKRRRIRVGDRIRFTDNVGGGTLLTQVTALHRFPDFAALYRALPLGQCGYTEEELAGASPADMERY